MNILQNILWKQFSISYFERSEKSVLKEFEIKQISRSSLNFEMTFGERKLLKAKIND